MSHYGNLINWRDFDPPPSSSSDMIRSWEDSVNQLECSGLLQIVQLFEEEGKGEQEKCQSRADIMPARMMDEIQKDARVACRRFIMRSYDRAGQWQTTRSFLDSYDLVAATVGYICLEVKQVQASSTGPRAKPPNKAELMEVVHKSSVLVTQIASRFPALDGFHRVFLNLSSKAVGEVSCESQRETLSGSVRPQVHRKLLTLWFLVSGHDSGLSPDFTVLAPPAHRCDLLYGSYLLVTKIHY
jgi:hypothetical protein